jgi:hypothetical protein
MADAMTAMHRSMADGRCLSIMQCVSMADIYVPMSRWPMAAILMDRCPMADVWPMIAKDRWLMVDVCR